MDTSRTDDTGWSLPRVDARKTDLTLTAADLRRIHAEWEARNGR